MLLRHLLEYGKNADPDMARLFAEEEFRSEYQARSRDAIMKKYKGRKLLHFWLCI